MHSIFVQYLFLILIILALNLIADKLRPAYPIVLVLGRSALSFTCLIETTAVSVPQPDFVYNFYRDSCYPRVSGPDATVGDPNGEGRRQVHHDLGS